MSQTEKAQKKDNTIAADVMSSDLITIKQGQTVEQALKLLVNYKITGVPVVDSAGKMIGVLSEYDIIRQIDRQNNSNQSSKTGQISSIHQVDPECFQQPAEFSGEPFHLPRTTTLDVLLRHFIDSKYRRIPIVDENQKLVGIVTRRDLMRIYFYRAKLS